MAFVQAWPTPTNASGTTARSTSPTGGSTVASTPGNDLFLGVVTRMSGIEPSVVVTDNASNTWTQVHHLNAGTADLYLFHAANAASTDQVTASFFDPADDSPLEVETVIILLQEHSGVGARIDSDAATVPLNGGTLDPMAATAAGQLVVAVGGTGSSNRSWEVTGDGVTPVEASVFQASQTTLTTAYGHTDAAGPVAIGWNRAAGSETTYALIHALFDVGTGPQPLGVTVTGNDESLVDAPVNVAANVTGGTAPFTYTWSVITGSGTFGDDGAASTTYTPTAPGEHVIRCEVTDDTPEGAAQDDLTITVTGPETLHLASASGLTPVGAATLLDALSDDDYGTYGETGDDLDGTLTGTLPAIEPPAGDLDVVVPVSVNLGTATVTASISADGTTWVDADTTMPATTTPTLRTFTWAAAGISGYDQQDWQAMQLRVAFTAAD